jgi:hypothetical protein
MWGYSGFYRELPDGLSNIVAIAAGPEHSRRDLAIRKEGTVVEWSALGGSIEIGERVPGEEDGVRGFFTKGARCPLIEGLNDVMAVAVGGTQSLALRSNGTVVQWANGENVNAATRISLTASPPGTNGLVAIGGRILSNVVAVAASASLDVGAGGSPALRVNLAVQRDGTLVSWDDMGKDITAAVPK